MNMMLVDEATVLKYKLQPSTEELEAGITAYDSVHHAHLWACERLKSQYRVSKELEAN